MATDDSCNLMALSYAPTPTPTAMNYRLGNMQAYSGSNSGWGNDTDTIMKYAKTIMAGQSTPTITVAASTNAATKQEEPVMARLIRYTVVDPDRVLIEEKPEACLILEGRKMLNGTDEKGFLMDLAPQVAEKLTAHNAMRETVEYEDEEGRTKKLKPIRLGQLDVVVEVLKEYK